jgi:hypothetical protein
MDLDTLPTVALPWHCRPVGIIKIGGLAMILLESCLRLTAEILVEWVIFADITLEICMPWPCHVRHACDIGWCQSLVSFVDGGHRLLIRSDRRRCEVADCLGRDSAIRNHVVQLDVLIFRTAAPWWTWWSAVLAVEFHIPWFQALLWLHVDSIQKHIKISEQWMHWV